jgi:hypothetical protein
MKLSAFELKKLQPSGFEENKFSDDSKLQK